MFLPQHVWQNITLYKFKDKLRYENVKQNLVVTSLQNVVNKINLVVTSLSNVKQNVTSQVRVFNV